MYTYKYALVYRLNLYRSDNIYARQWQIELGFSPQRCE